MTLDFIRGAISMGFLVAAGYFFRFWRESRDRLFALFAVAFLLMSANSAWQSIIRENMVYSIIPYVIRLLAFLIILVAVADKNFRTH